MLARCLGRPLHDVAPRADMSRVTAGLYIKKLGDITGSGNDISRRYTGLNAHFVKHVNYVFRREATNRRDCLRHRDATADTANSTFDERCTGIECGQDISHPGACQIMNMEAKLDIGKFLMRAP